MVYTESSKLMECKPRVVSDVSLSIPCGMEEYQKMGPDLEGILCMQGGEGDGSYARNSEAPASAIALSKPFLRRAIDEMVLFSTEITSLCIADLGCATGANTISTLDFLVKILETKYHNNSISPPEFEAFFSDLPSNDFNTLFRSLPPRKENGKKKKISYYAAGVPGSFYERLFPRRKLHVAISLSALHWMSRIPEAVLDKDSPAYNRGRAWIDGAPKQVVEAYAKQSEEDLKAFLDCRAEEMVSGGLLFLLMAGRRDCEKPENQLDDPVTRAKHPFADSMDHTWNDLLKQGLVDEETRDAFNIPVYMRSRKEIRQAFDDSNAFDVNCIQFNRIGEHSKKKQEMCVTDPFSYAKTKANLVRATMRPLLDAHLRSSYLTDEFFNRFENRAARDITMLNKICYYGIIIVVATRK